MMLKHTNSAHYEEEIYNRIIVKRQAYDNRTRVFTLPIPYRCSSTVNESMVMKVIMYLQKNTCIKFTKQDKLEYQKPGLSIKKYSCKSEYENFGMFKKRPTSVRLPGDCSNDFTCILRRLLMALGVKFTHVRHDRDKYVSVKKEHIKKGYKRYFNPLDEENSTTFGMQYDYGSLMQQSVRFLGNPKVDTLIPKLYPYKTMMGAQKRLSFNDRKILNLLYCDYRCKGHENEGRCQYDSYLDPNDCHTCICPRGYDGRFCHVEKHLENSLCKVGPISVGEEEKIIELKGITNCTLRLLGKEGNPIELFLTVDAQPKLRCVENNSPLEVKYRKDRGTTGMLFCGIHRYFELTTETNEALLIYRGLHKDDRLHVRYKINSKIQL
uniref:Metalloendopeptidase n=1 Tax=Parastrongyloides trichosuri TaxID=131310 RepID=A0A0N4ZGG6_PARTI